MCSRAALGTFTDQNRYCHQNGQELTQGVTTQDLTVSFYRIRSEKWPWSQSIAPHLHCDARSARVIPDNKSANAFFACALLAPAAALLALAGWRFTLKPPQQTLKAVILRRSSRLSENRCRLRSLGVDVLEQIRIQAKRHKVGYRVAKSVNDGIRASKDPQATGFCYLISVQGCH